MNHVPKLEKTEEEMRRGDIRTPNQNLGAFGPDLVSTFGTPPIFGGEGGVPLLGLAAVGGVGEAEVEGATGAEGKEGIDGPDGVLGVFGFVVGGVFRDLLRGIFPVRPFPNWATASMTCSKSSSRLSIRLTRASN